MGLCHHLFNIKSCFAGSPSCMKQKLNIALGAPDGRPCKVVRLQPRSLHSFQNTFDDLSMDFCIPDHTALAHQRPAGFKLRLNQHYHFARFCKQLG